LLRDRALDKAMSVKVNVLPHAIVVHALQPADAGTVVTVAPTVANVATLPTIALSHRRTTAV
jgi:hypothetical protein